MSQFKETREFQKKFKKDIVEILAVTGASGVGAGNAGKDIMWNASIQLIAWREINSRGPVIKEKTRLEWLVDDKEWKTSSKILKANSIARLLVRRSEKSMMLVKVVELECKDNELEIILQESLKPVYFFDETLGKFKLDKTVNLFETKVRWANEEGNLYFDWDEDNLVMNASLNTAHVLFKDQENWNMKIREYASEELLGLANEWLQDNDEANVNEITKDMIIALMKLDSISVQPEGDFEIFFFDGDMFWGHCIIVRGNTKGEFFSADIAG